MQTLLNFESKFIRYTLLVLGIGFGCLIYSQGLPGSYIHDDYPNIVLNSSVHIEELNFDSLISSSFSSQAGTLRRPISMLSFAINHYYTKLDPFYFKSVNIFIHLLTAFAFFLLARTILDCYRDISKISISSNQVFYIALASSIAWLLSPINLTGVLYVVQRMTSLSAMFCIFGLFFYIQARRSMIFRGKVNIQLFSISALLLILSIFSKENGALSLFYLLFIEIFILKYQSNAWINQKYFRILFLSIIIMPTLAIVLYLTYDPSFITKGYEHRSFSLCERALTQFRALIFYVKMIVIPNNIELGIFHDDFEISKSLFQPISTLFSITAVLIFTIGTYIYRKKYPLFAFGIFFFLASHILESTIISLEIMYEHRNYIGSFGIIFAAFYLIFVFSKNKVTKNVAIFFCCSWLAAISFTTTSRVNQWKDPILHAYYQTLHHPKSSRAHFYLGRTYANLAAIDLIDDTDEAFNALEKSMGLTSTEISAEAVAIRLAGVSNIPAKTEWIESIIKKIKHNPITHNTVGGLSELIKCLEIKCSISKNDVFQVFQAALNNKRPYPDRFKSSLLMLYAGFSLNYLEDPNVAYRVSKEAVLLSPDDIAHRMNFIAILIALGQVKEIEDQLNYVELHDKFRIYGKMVEEIRGKISNTEVST